MKISVIVTSYNYEQYIRRTLDSLVNQTYKDFDVIIVDDGSKDNSLNIIKEYTEKYSNFHLFTHENNQNKGLIESLKLGISKTESDYIVFLESDDFLREDYMQEKVNFINDNPNSVIIVNDMDMEGNIALYEDYVHWLSKIYKKNKKNILFKLFYTNNAIVTFSVVMIKSDILKNLDFNTPNPAWLDWWLWRQVSIQYPISYIDKKLTVWNRHDGSYICENEEENERKRYSFIKKSNQLLFKNYTSKYIFFALQRNINNFIKSIFSIRNEYKECVKHKVITVLGFKIKYKL